MSAKSEILSRLHRHSAGESAGEYEASPLLESEAMLQVDVGGIEDWQSRLEAMHASVEEIDSRKAVMTAIETKMHEWQLEAAVLAPGLDDLSAMFSHLPVRIGVAGAADTLAVGWAYAGVIESGALVMLSSATSPVSNHFLPEYSIIVVDAANIFPTLEAVWQEMADIGEPMPRTINIITGPSKTADIEQTIVYGAHGPKVLHVILLRTQLLA